MKILFLTNIPVPYRIDFFNELGKTVDLTVVFDRKLADDRNKEWLNKKVKNFKAIFLHSIKVKSENAISLEVIKYLNASYDHIIIGTHVSYTALLAMLYMKIRGIKYIFNCDGGVFYKDESKIKYLMKKFFISNAQYYLSTGKKTNEWLKYYGANECDIFIYPFSSFYNNYIKNDKRNKVFIKNKLNIKEDIVILFVGQFIYRKGIDILVKSLDNLKNIDNIGVYIIGGESINLKIDKVKSNIYFINFLQPEKLKEYFLASDIFVLPTREDSWGLVINEAMANGLPVITTDKCNAGLELIKNGENGFITSVDNAEELGEKLKILCSNKDLREQMGKNNLTKIKKYTIENMVAEHINILNMLRH